MDPTIPKNSKEITIKLEPSHKNLQNLVPFQSGSSLGTWVYETRRVRISFAAVPFPLETGVANTSAAQVIPEDSGRSHHGPCLPYGAKRRGVRRITSSDGQPRRTCSPALIAIFFYNLYCM